MFESCQRCGEKVIFGHKTPSGIFCSRRCSESPRISNFCDQCESKTVEVGVGNTWTVNGVGTMLWGRKDACPNCGSVVRRLFFCILFIPIIPLDKFRVIDIGSNRYISRRVGSTYRTKDAQPLLDMAAKLESVDRDLAVAKYRQIISRFPGTAASGEAEKAVKSLTSHMV